MTSVYGSDLVADVIRSTGAPYIALNPGSSYRGLHDSLVNHLGAEDPEILLCLHEEHAVAIAHGWAKVTGEPLVVALHANVGLMHASMALYNAWCDRVPMLVIGANGPLNATRRRPWIDWIHTSTDLAALVRPFIKWDDQPASVGATLQSLARAWDTTRAYPSAPVLITLDVSVQEEAVAETPRAPRLGGKPVTPVAPPEAVSQAVGLLKAAERPVILVGRVSRDQQDWDDRVRLAEALGARVVTDLKTAGSFPTSHSLHAVGPGYFLGPAGRDAIEQADCILALDWVDLAGTLYQATGRPDDVPLIHATLDHVLHNGWAKDHQERQELDVLLPTSADRAVAQLLAALGGSGDVPVEARGARKTLPPRADDGTPIMLPDVADALRHALAGNPATLVRLPLGWNGGDWDVLGPLDYLGTDGGGGIGAGPGMLIGAALALRGTGRIPIGILGDGDTLMGIQALWTAARSRIAMLAIIANNRSYFNDEVHQERVAKARGRDVSRKGIAQQIDDPAPDLAGLARAQGLDAFGPITTVAELSAVLAEALELVRTGRPVLLDVIVGAGYTPAMSEGLVRD